jgi:protoheme IX farnesyltransferase
MKSATLSVARGQAILDRVVDYVELTKPRIAVLVLATVASGALIASRGSIEAWVVLHAVVGTALVAAGSSVWNQLAERTIDARMHRTEFRPLPAGRVAPAEAATLAAALSISGLAYLTATVGGPAVWLAAASLVLYSFIYTPMKRYTTLNTIVGAIPGALPPVIGWAAATGRVDSSAWILFWIIFFWQFPHFFAIAWLYRADYERGGLRMLPTSELGRRLTGPVMLGFCAALIPVTLLPSKMGMAGPVYFWGALVLGIQFLCFTASFVRRRTDEGARMLLWASLAYLPAVFALLLVDALRS